MVWLKPVIPQLKNHFSSAQGAHVTTETICKAAQKKQVKTDGDRTLQLTSIDLLLEREKERETVKVMWADVSGLSLPISVLPLKLHCS